MASHELLDRLPLAAENVHSAERVEKLAESAADLEANVPGYVGMTAYGSIVRGEANEGSDADGYVYIEPIVDERQGIVQWNDREGSLYGTSTFGYPEALAYKTYVGAVLNKHGIEKSGMDVLPINAEIVQSQVALTVDAAKVFDEIHQGGATAPRNIRGLFHADIDTIRLQGYRAQVLEGFAQSEHGDTAWRMVRYMVSAFEIGRQRVAREEFDVVAHRKLPETLMEARIFYTTTNTGSEELVPARSS